MQLDLSRFSPAERSTLQLRVLYEGAGYRKFRCSHFEEYSLYQQNERFLSDSQVITFTDLDGKLRAIKPDVTLSIAKNAQPAAGECKKYYYTEQICRPSRESHTFSEISQMGLECIGAVGAAEQAEVVRLALESLASLEVPTVLEVSHMGFVTALLDTLHVDAAARPRLLELLRDKNAHELHAAALQSGLDEAAANALTAILSLHGPFGTTLAAARMDFGETGCCGIRITGRSPLPANTVHLMFAAADGGETERRVVEFGPQADWGEQTFTFEPVTGARQVTFLFLPGTQFDFDSFTFI